MINWTDDIKQERALPMPTVLRHKIVTDYKYYFWPALGLGWSRASEITAHFLCITLSLSLQVLTVLLSAILAVARLSSLLYLLCLSEIINMGNVRLVVFVVIASTDCFPLLKAKMPCLVLPTRVFMRTHVLLNKLENKWCLQTIVWPNGFSTSGLYKLVFLQTLHKLRMFYS